MAGFLDDFRKKVVMSAWKDVSSETGSADIDDKIALGVLLWVVAESDSKFLPSESEKIKDILLEKTDISDEDVSVVMAAVETAAAERIDLYRFTSHVSEDLPNDMKLSIIKDLFRVACADKELDNNELEMIRKITGLFRLSHKDFIDAKLAILDEAGLDPVSGKQV